ncbi:MAG: hypothetical protein DME65_12455 [Verrucomicrobia bacterium]|nr:MAG: hypothetical protein DME65_12455 [Verrucomicrobiota bacterium]
MVMTLAPGSRGFFFLFARGLDGHAAQIGITIRKCIVGNNDSKPIASRQFSAAEFARLSPSMKASLLIIRRAQLSSRKAIAATAEWKKLRGGG